MKINKVLCALLSSAMLFGIAACKNNDDDDTPSVTVAGTTVTAPKVTTGTVAADAVKTENGVKTATLSTSDGSYKFTENASANASISAREAVSVSVDAGTWTFTETGKTTPKYAGTYTGKISDIATATGTTLKLTVTRTVKDGKLVKVASKKDFDFKASTTEGFKAEIPSVTVPAVADATPDCVGTDELSGKTFERTYDGGKEVYTFKDGIAEETDSSEEGDGEAKITYSYSWNATEKLVYLQKKSSSAMGYTMNSAEDEVKAYIDYMKKYGGTLSEEDKECLNEETKYNWSMVDVYKYIISDGKLYLEPYFDGVYIPTKGLQNFNFGSNANWSVNFSSDCLKLKDNTGDGKTYISYPVFSDGNFSGTLYKKTKKAGEKDSTLTKVGAIKGTYTISANTSVKLNFTEVPETVSTLKGEFELKARNYN